MGRRDGAATDRLIVAVDPETDLYRAVIVLGDSQKKNLGSLPYAAWKEYASDGRIVAVVGAGEPLVPLAYVSFRLSRNQVAIAHLAVAPSARRRGLARQLVEYLSNTYSDRAGLTLLCRRDFPAHEMWPKLGFVPQGDRLGRGKTGKPLTRWWLDHGHTHLLSWQGAPEHQRPVVLDNNVFLDLHGLSGGKSQASKDILLGTLEGRVELLLTPEIHTEIDRRTPAQDRAHMHSIADTYPSLAVRPDQLAAAIQTLSDAVAPDPKHRQQAVKSMRPQDLSDVRHIAYAAAGGVDLVVTRDEPAMARFGSVAAASLGVRLVTPQDLITVIDEEENAPRYWPAALLGTGYTAVEMSSDDQDLVGTFLMNGAGERKASLRDALRQLAAAPHARRLVYRDPARRPVALLGAASDGTVLHIPVLRIRPSALAASLASQMISKLRELALDLGVRVIQLEEQHLDDLLFAAAERDGYFRTADHLTALTIPSLASCAELSNLVAAAYTAGSVTPLPAALTDAARKPKGADVAAALEHQLRPLRLIDANLPTLLVPIKPHWASHLFDAPRQLFGPPDHLGISREHVYYRAPRREGADPPARVLWYASAPTSEVIACSALLEVEQGDPERLWRKNRRLGVYNRQQVADAASKAGQVRALRVADTEVFERPVSLKTLRQICARHRRPTPQLISPSPITAAMFAAIIKEARS